MGSLTLLERFGNLGMEDLYIRLVAHTLTAALSANCLQLSPAPCTPCNAPSTLGQAGFTAPRAAAAYRALMVGRYRLKAAHDR